MILSELLKQIRYTSSTTWLEKNRSNCDVLKINPKIPSQGKTVHSPTHFLSKDTSHVRRIPPRIHRNARISEDNSHLEYFPDRLVTKDKYIIIVLYN